MGVRATPPPFFLHDRLQDVYRQMIATRARLEETERDLLRLANRTKKNIFRGFWNLLGNLFDKIG